MSDDTGWVRTYKKGKRLVCSECLTEACFAGVLMCDDARTASVIEVTRPEVSREA